MSERDAERAEDAAEEREPNAPDPEATEGPEGDVPEGDFPDEGLPGEGELDDVDVRDLLRGALRPPAGSVAPELLGGVQRRLRVRSQGKFYGDGWSTASAPRSTYLITSVLMLVLILIVAILLIPWEAVGL